MFCSKNNFFLFIVTERQRGKDSFLWALREYMFISSTSETKECCRFKLFRSCFHWKQMPAFSLGKSQEVRFSRNQQQNVSKLRTDNPASLGRRGLTSISTKLSLRFQKQIQRGVFRAKGLKLCKRQSIEH